MSISSAAMILVTEIRVFLWLSVKELLQMPTTGSQYGLARQPQRVSVKPFTGFSDRRGWQAGMTWSHFPCVWFHSCQLIIQKCVLNNLKSLEVSHTKHWHKDLESLSFGQPSLIHNSFLNSWHDLRIVFLRHEIKTTVLAVWFLLCD